MDVLHIIETKLNKQYKPKKGKIVYEPFHPADMLATWADITKAKNILGWQPQTTLDEGIESAIKWYKNNHGLAVSIKL